MEVSEFIGNMPPDRQALLTVLHDIIISNDPSVSPVVKAMMGKSMILYEEGGVMKYGLASVKKHMSLHCLPMYMDPSLHAKYEALLPSVRFQKGCINFTETESMPARVIISLIVDCSSVNIADVLENRKKK